MKMKYFLVSKIYQNQLKPTQKLFDEVHVCGLPHVPQQRHVGHLLLFGQQEGGHGALLLQGAHQGLCHVIPGHLVCQTKKQLFLTFFF